MAASYRIVDFSDARSNTPELLDGNVHKASRLFFQIQ